MTAPASRAARKNVIGNAKRCDSKDQRHPDKVKCVELKETGEQSQRDQSGQRRGEDQEPERAGKHCAAIVLPQVLTVNQERDQ